MNLFESRQEAGLKHHPSQSQTCSVWLFYVALKPVDPVPPSPMLRLPIMHLWVLEVWSDDLLQGRRSVPALFPTSDRRV